MLPRRFELRVQPAPTAPRQHTAAIPWSTIGIVSGILAALGALVALIWRTTRPQSFDLRVLGRAQSDLGITIASDPTRVAQMLANYDITVSADWCAVAVGTWILEAAASAGVTPPIAGSPGAKATMGQFQDAGMWLDAATLQADPTLIQPGMVPVWQRGDPTSWTGHIGVVSQVLGDGQYKSIEGNSGPTGGTVAENTHAVTDANLLGMGYFGSA